MGSEGMKHYPNCRALTSGHCDCDEGAIGQAIPGEVLHRPDDAEPGVCLGGLEYGPDSVPLPPPETTDD